jgi:hypothetical protein
MGSSRLSQTTATMLAHFLHALHLKKLIQTTSLISYADLYNVITASGMLFTYHPYLSYLEGGPRTAMEPLVPVSWIGDAPSPATIVPIEICESPHTGRLVRSRKNIFFVNTGS